jgi:hypothetical protein
MAKKFEHTRNKRMKLLCRLLSSTFLGVASSLGFAEAGTFVNVNVVAQDEHVKFPVLVDIRDQEGSFDSAYSTNINGKCRIEVPGSGTYVLQSVGTTFSESVSLDIEDGEDLNAPVIYAKSHYHVGVRFVTSMGVGAKELGFTSVRLLRMETDELVGLDYVKSDGSVVFPWLESPPPYKMKYFIGSNPQVRTEEGPGVFRTRRPPATNLLPEIVVPNAKVSGRVLDTVDVPLEGVGVYIASTDSGWETSTMSDAMGRFTCHFLKTGTYSAIFRPRESSLAISVLEGITVEQDSSVSVEDIVLDLAGFVAGTASDSEGQSLEGVKFTLDPLPFRPLLSSLPAVSDSAGDYRLNRVPPGQFSVRAEAPDGQTLIHQNLFVESQQTLTGVDFEFPEATGSISGSVLESVKDQPLAGVEIIATGVGNPYSVSTSITGSDGAYSVASLPAGTYQVEAALEGYDPGLSENIVVSIEEQSSGVNFVLLPTE